jgi:c-di-GMP-binding flagellar brake protein YcgR
MTAPRSVLLIDNGELDAVATVLEQIGTDFERLGGDSIRSPLQHPERLLITSAVLAHSLRIQRLVMGNGPRATWIAFVAGESKTQKSMLQKSGFDFLVREPVHPAALRVLLQRALFRGEDARRAPRVACGHPVTYKTGFWRQKATLIDLSPRGCRLLTEKPVKEKSEITVQIPKELAAGRAFDLVGHAVRVVPAERECGRSGEVVVGVRFAPLEGDLKTRLRAALAERVLGPAVLPSSVAVPPAGPVTARPKTGFSHAPDAADAGAPARPKRIHPRARYDKKITAMEGADAYMLLCRDLSAGGMRVEPVEGLAVGARVDLAIQVSAREEPFLVEAIVVRDDGEQGLALRFEWIAPESQARLQSLVANLPSIEALQEDARDQGTILAQRLPSKPGRPAR